MKKIIFYLLFIAFSSLAFQACTEEEVAPSNELQENGGTGVSDPKG